MRNQQRNQRKEGQKYTMRIIILLLGFVLCLSQQKINNQIFNPVTYINKQFPLNRLQSTGHRFSIQSNDLNYQLNGQVYQSQQILNQDDIYNISKYKKSESCTYFKSLIQMESIEGHIIDFVALHSVVSQKNQQLFVLGMQDTSLPNFDKKFVNVYTYNATNTKFITKITFENTKLNASIQKDLFMTNFNDIILFSDGNYLYQLNLFLWNQNGTINSEYNWQDISNFNNGQNIWNFQQFLGLTTTKYQDKQVLLFLYSEKITFFQFDSTIHRANRFVEIEKQGMDAFQDVEIGSNSFYLYALARNKLLFYKPQNLQNPVIHQLAGQRCTRIYIYQSTIHTICEYQNQNFISQYFYNQTSNELILNRFYNDIQNYRLISYVKNYLLLVGQNEIILTSNGVNRKILLQMPKSSYSQKFVSFGIQNIHLLNQLKVYFDNNKTVDKNQTLFAVGQDFIVLFKLKYVQSQIWCYFNNHPANNQKNIIMVRNVSVCQLNQKKATLKSICMNIKPIQIKFQKYELQQKSTSILLVIILLLICVLIFFCLGCVFKENMNLNHMMEDIKNKVSKLKNKKKDKHYQLKEI